MVVSKKLSEKEIQKFIEKGGWVSKEKEKEKFFVMTLRMPASMCEEIDAIVKEKAGYNRTTWILRTIQKQLKIEQMGLEKSE